jgi:nitroreductase
VALLHDGSQVDAARRGHIAQNLYLAAESIGCGACTLGEYWQEGADRFCGVDGEDEYVVYLASVERVAKPSQQRNPRVAS